MHAANGGCDCGNLRMELQLTAAPETYRPRACDCDFCRKHVAAYLSDAAGSLLIRIKNPHDRGTYRQGSGQAEFLLCRNCGVLVGVVHRSDGRLYAAVNVKAMEDAIGFGAEQSVSPKKLSADEKTRRWQQLWFRDVRIHGDS